MLRLRTKSKISISLVFGAALVFALTGCSSCAEDSNDPAANKAAKETPQDVPSSAGLRVLPTDSNHTDNAGEQPTRVIRPLGLHISDAGVQAAPSASAKP